MSQVGYVMSGNDKESALMSICTHNDDLANIVIRGVPQGVHAALQHKAWLRHQSLEQYLSVELRHLAQRRSLTEILDDVDTTMVGPMAGRPTA